MPSSYCLRSARVASRALIIRTRFSRSQCDTNTSLHSGGQNLKIVGFQPRLLRDLRKQTRTDLITIMKRERIAGPPRAFETTMRTVLPRHLSSDPKQRGQTLPRLHGPPLAHATLKTLASGAGTSSPCSMQSAATRSASARTAVTAASRVSP
jgi:hypothetical protein